MVNCLVFDLGAGSGRAMLSTFNGDTLELSEIHRFSGLETTVGDGPRWDLLRLLDEVDQGLAIACERCERIDAIGVDSWGVDYALVDAQGRLDPLPFHYRHARSRRGYDAFPMEAEALFARTGSQILPVNTAYQLFSASREGDAKLGDSVHALMIADAINFHLTGSASINSTLARTTGLLSLDGRWQADICAVAGIPPSLLPHPVDPGTTIGTLRPTIAARAAATKDTVVIAVAAHDTASAVCGLPLGGQDAFLICGSWSILGCERPRPIVSRDAWENQFGNEGGTEGLALVLKSLNGLHLLQKLRTAWNSSTEEKVDFVDMSRAARLAVAAGRKEAIDPSAPIFFNPADLIAAMESHCPSLAGQSDTRLGALTLAVYRGLCEDISTALAALERTTGGEVMRLRICGGGGQDSFLCQMIADRTGRTVAVGPIEASAWGNALMQLVGLGHVENIAAGRKLIEKSTVILNYYPDNATGGSR